MPPSTPPPLPALAIPPSSMSPARTRTSPSSSRGSSRQNSSPAEATNTLIVTQLPRECFERAWLAAIRAVFARHGDIHAFAPISFLRRAIVTFYRPEDAERAKRQLDGLVLPSQPPAKIRVYRGANTAIRAPTSPTGGLDGPDPFYLAPPRLEKNFLISPPGSPPVGWEPVVEDPPNAAPLAHDLIAALSKLQLRRRKSSTEIVYEPCEMTDGVGITVCVEDFGDSPAGSDDEEESPWSPPRTKFAPTALPPLVR